MKAKLLHFLAIILIAVSCTTEELPSYESPDFPDAFSTRAVPTPDFNWETADWMPAPTGQSRIPSPWNGAGSIVSTYGMEITNDRYKKDGWELVYNTFDSSSPGALINPYFILYNKYRGVLRIYLYLTTQFVAPSSYIQSGISVISQSRTSLLNFLGKDIIDATDPNVTQYTQLNSAPTDGSSPLAANKWYMLQYELAYDPGLASIPYNKIQLSWSLNYCNVQTIRMEGTQQGKINGTIGANSSSNLFSNFGDLGKAVGTGVLAGVGMNFITNNTINEKTGENKLGLSNSVFQSISSGLKSALSGSVSSLPGALFKGLSAIFGSQGSQAIPVNLQIQTKIELTGNISERGSFPSSPTSFWVPGTNIAADAVGYIPLYTKPLGVINFNGRPEIQTTLEFEGYGEEDPYDGSLHYAEHVYCIPPKTIDYSKYLIINPEVQKIATVTIKKQDLICGFNYPEFNPKKIWIGDETQNYGQVGSSIMKDLAFFVRFTIEIKPKNGDTTSVIIKTFRLKEKRIERN